MNKIHRIELLIIDPQNDFCYPGAEVFFKDNLATMTQSQKDSVENTLRASGLWDSGSLFVPGANKDMDRVANFIDEVGDKIYSIHATMDCHHHIDIAHPVTWINSRGEHPNPFTIISVDDVKKDVWFSTFPQERQYCKQYVYKLAENNRYPLCIWPPHCLIGTVGNSVYKPLADALLRWEKRNNANVNYLTKGSNWKTEHYSAVKADVPDDEDPTTEMNLEFIKPLKDADELLLTGEALSHCLANTVKDIAEGFGDDSLIKKFTLLQGASSNVPSFEWMGQSFIDELSAKGMKISEHIDTYLR
jgi:nicotinamidase/pyrazinamidase